ncbi:hypothetical protein FBUS_01929 [Fasciolopsis buskii]|uniref:Uncharacterized protein n=1 Tax=Fasciolopsis buskii TaxID=27845 RepID=A0A8E0RZZ4_9TREM|nr:hypothetical protein FBUS_01929 [Fasciolopsis buski]
MNALCLNRALDDLLGCARKEKKTKLEKVLSKFENPKVIDDMDSNSELKHLDRSCHVFTWNTCLQVVIKVLMDEIRVACRSSKAEPTMSSELQQCFKLLTLVVSHGSHGNLVLNLDDLVTLFLSTAKETSMCFVRLPLFRALQMLFQRCESHSVALRPSLWDELVFWCCGQWRESLEYNSAHLLCLVLSHAITAHTVSWCYIWESLVGFLRG